MPIRLIKPLIVFAFCGILTAAAYWQKDLIFGLLESPDHSDGDAASANSTYTVERRPLKITISEVGALRAVKNHQIHPPSIFQRVTISWVIEENHVVEKGDKILEFDDQPFTEKIKELETRIEEQEDQIQVAKDDLAYFQKINERDIRKATDAVDNAEQQLRDYKHNEAIDKRRTLQQNIIDAQQAYKDAKKKHEQMQVQAAEASFNDGAQAHSLEQQVENSREALGKAQEKVRNSYTAYKEFKNKTYPEKLESLLETLNERRKSLEEARKIAAADEEKYKSQIRNGRDAIEGYKEEIENNRKKIDNCVMTAPVDGVVLYGDPEMPQYRRYIKNKLEPGNQVHARQNIALLTIPDFSEFVIDVPVGEQYRGRISRGAPAQITVDAVPGEIFTGEVKNISTVSKPRNPQVPSSPKVYDAVVTMNDQDDRLVSGMTARVTIITEDLDNVLAVPVEAVFNNQGETVCYAANAGVPELRKVVTGKLNDDFVQILDGLQVNDQVWLHRPE